ncbi:PREDICTED: zinc finger MYM-type protein 1-like [Amphimedon queenslandica]|uniref:DUF4371 domain-containing protein n=2 Tax=Amphimedon queenslandica TaxID=400682 RepID=A0AAN0IPM3_AMPQE|nr:PREDICTED: zinc finger MYM-type protein 1-like [Amphimedon queenslandica]|eukprot:XP_011406506.1 PREDICTED: zinc finger MYM-type protein 1-like [Amphimedon queenslandica]
MVSHILMEPSLHLDSQIGSMPLELLELLQNMISLEAGASIANQLSSSRQEQVKKNRYYIQSISEVLLLCARNDIALRGHNESVSIKPGNFRSILQLLARHDPSLLQSLQKHPCNATYLSPEIQNELLQVMGNIIRHQIQQEVNRVGFFTLLCDETRDISKKEQMTIVLRYVSEATVYERFLCFVYAKELNAESLTKYICDTLKIMSIPITNCISQGYDGASVMSGSCTGVQTRIKELAPKAIYIYCSAHRLNLILVDSVKGIGFALEFFALVELIYVFLSASKTHSIFLDVQKEVSPHKQPMELK